MSPDNAHEQIEEALQRAADRRSEQKESAAGQLREGRQLYSNESGEAILRDSFAIYLDALGTKESVRDLDDRSLRAQLALLDRLRWFLHDADLEQDLQRFLSFSDNVVLGVPRNERLGGGDGLGVLLPSIDGYQLNLAANGRFLRGGISVGPLYMDHELVTGQALVEAVLLEEHTAVYPRVLLSPGCTELLLRDLAEEWSNSMQSSPWNEQVLVDADGLLFVNYLPAVGEEPEAIRIERIKSGLKAHRDAIEAKLGEFNAPGRVRDKYVWAAHYHNYVRGEFFGLVEGDFDVTQGLYPVEELYPRSFRRLIPLG